MKKEGGYEIEFYRIFRLGMGRVQKKSGRVS